MKRFILLVVIMCILTGCQRIAKEKTEVNGTVVDMQYQSSYKTLMIMSNGKSTALIPQIHPAQYLITISYKNVSETFDDEKLYKSVKEGDTIQVILEKSYDTDGNLIEQTLCLPE